MAGKVTASIEGNEIVIRVKKNDVLTPSASGKTLVVASSYGNQATDLVVEGQNVTVGFNAYIPNKKKAS